MKKIEKNPFLTFLLLCETMTWRFLLPRENRKQNASRVCRLIFFFVELLTKSRFPCRTIEFTRDAVVNDMAFNTNDEQRHGDGMENGWPNLTLNSLTWFSHFRVDRTDFNQIHFPHSHSFTVCSVYSKFGFYVQLAFIYKHIQYVSYIGYVTWYWKRNVAWRTAITTRIIINTSYHHHNHHRWMVEKKFACIFDLVFPEIWNCVHSCCCIFA